jgi:hypothetical protein
MWNPWISLGLDAAQLTFKLTRLMAVGVAYPTGSSREVPDYARVSEVRAPVPQGAVVEEKESAVAITDDSRHESKTSRTEARRAPKRAASKRIAPKRPAVPRRGPKRAAAASLACQKAVRRSALKGK